MANDPNEIPEPFRVIADELSAEDWAKLREVQRAMQYAREHDIVCTGRPDRVDCDCPPFATIVLHGQMFATVCVDCVDPVVSALFKAGHESCRQDPFKDYPAEWLAEFSRLKRERQIDQNTFAIPAGKRRK